ncbi:hypothetical protein DY000_02058562 [Brassica cretica]|uniref:CMP/dCMP-type deaminase domain-containing protein n=1 Tax=Brassica cretica TaxID=69181 RepID=A0ABQ7AST7_BRACR|nr:hypothetical protein DY000_02058562 [Brassica cretica]
MDSCRIDVLGKFGRYVATEPCMCLSLRSDRAWLELGHYVATEPCSCSVATSVVSGLLSLLKVERDKIGGAPYDGCLRTHVEGIKPFIVHLGVKVLMTSFPARPLRSSLYVEVIRCVAADGILYGVFDTMPRDVRDQCDGFRARPRSNYGFKGCDDYFDLQGAFIEEDNFVEKWFFRRLRRLAMLKIDLIFRMPRFVLEMFTGLKMFHDIARV